MLAGKAGRLLLAAALIIALGAPAISASAREPVMLNRGPVAVGLARLQSGTGARKGAAGRRGAG